MSALRLLRAALRLAAWVGLVGAIVYLWPAALGGSTRFVVVHGSSMEPTYRAGDLLVARDADELSVGQVVVFRVPDGEVGEGRLVIHRLVIDHGDGSFEMQGDNRAAPDPWLVTPETVVGSPVGHLPRAGLLVQALVSWFGIALVAAGLMAWALWPDRDDADPSGLTDVG